MLQGEYLVAAVRDPRFQRRFWSKVRKGPSCWEWRASKDGAGYGQIAIRPSRPIRTHRASWLLHYGAIPPGLCVLHRCDNPPCVNPAHLFLGTRQENIADCMAKDRHNRGTRVWWAKLTEAQVTEIRAKRAAGFTLRAIAREFGVCHQTVGEIIAGTRWRHVPSATN